MLWYNGEQEKVMNGSNQDLKGQATTSPSEDASQPRPGINIPVGRLILFIAISVLLIGGVTIATRKEKNLLRPSTISAAEIIRRNLEKFILPNTIYHQKTKQYLGESNDPNIYEIWEDQESDRFYNEATYADGRKITQGFDGELHFDIDFPTKTIHKDIYVYDNQSSPEPVGKRLDIAEQFDELLRNGVLEAKEGTLEGQEVYVVYDTRQDPEKHWDVLTFDKKNFQLLQTEKYGTDRKLEELVKYEIQEAVARTEANLANLFSYQDQGLDFSLYQRKFYTSKPEQEEYILIRGPQATPESTVIPLSSPKD